MVWGPHGIRWSQARAILQRQCGCNAGEYEPTLSVCHRCQGVRLPSPMGAPRPCLWCTKPSNTVCPGCFRLVHNRGACSWNNGMNALYTCQALEQHWVCPDCWVVLVEQITSSSCPLISRAPPPDLSALMNRLIAQMQPGAGISPNRNSRRWKVGSNYKDILRHLRRGEWISEHSLSSRCLQDARDAQRPTSFWKTRFAHTITKLIRMEQIWKRETEHQTKYKRRLSDEAAPPALRRRRR